ncbi:MAG: LacI family DNA-binding transcriptional regulator [Pseudomonadota bacterium]
MATIKDVARLAGVGVGTASRALSGKGPVSREAVARVNAAIVELDFRPSHIARALSANSLGMIGIFVPFFRSKYYCPVLQTFDNELRAVDRHMLVVSGCGKGDLRSQALEGLNFLIQRDCDGIIVVSQDISDDDIIQLHRKQPRLVLMNRVVPALLQNSFCCDHRHGGVLAAQTLLTQGHRKFAVISGPITSPDNAKRIEGFFGELALHGIERRQVPTIESDFTTQGGWFAARALLDSGLRFTGLFCANDELGMGALSYFHQAGIHVPKDVSVVGYDDISTSAFTAPQMTSIHIPVEDIASNCLRLLLNQCYGSSHPICRDFPISVTMRDSVGPAKTGQYTIEH